MKTKLINLLACILLLSLTQCKEEDAEKITYEPENIFPDFYDLAALKFDKGSVNDFYYEYGFSFQFLNKGVIKNLKVKLPDNQTNLRITIWTAGTKEVIKTFTIPDVKANVEFVLDIPDLEVEKDKKYTISLFSNDYFFYKKGSSAVSLPVTKGNIQITDYHSQSFNTPNATPQYPTIFLNTSIWAGELSFDFQRME
ncbi:MAG: hypothetical protein O9302_13885 [Cyclobacteriaceae bacterium]|nr:hypothetical protein [Cytophagales bacterium]MCZ8329152.1 hypothetical protein [Cyclobacteriaceae bacterium]